VAFPSVASAVAAVPVTATIEPASPAVRAVNRRIDGGEILVLFNEGAEPYQGELPVAAPFVYTFHFGRGLLQSLPLHDKRVSIQLDPGATSAYFLSHEARNADNACRLSEEELVLYDRIQAKPYRRYIVGEHDFEVIPQDQPAVPFAQAMSWRNWLTADFSGQVDYSASFELPKGWAGEILQLETGLVEYAAQVLWDGKPVGNLLWPPWHVELPPAAAGRHEITIRVANTLSNELTSQRVAEAWKSKNGPGWPSPYHKRAIEFERESRGGGLQGPIRVRTWTRP